MMNHIRGNKFDQYIVGPPFRSKIFVDFASNCRIMRSTRTRCSFGKRSLLLLLPPFLYFLQMSIKYLANSGTDQYHQVAISSADDGFRSEVQHQTFQFHRHRIRWWWMGRCIDSLDGERLVVVFCDPDQEQTFSLTIDNKLVHDRSAKCVGRNLQHSPSLILFRCDDVETMEYISKFEIQNGTYIITRSAEGELKQQCLTPLSRYKSRPCLGDNVGVTKCDNVASRVVLLEENFFQTDRKLLKNLALPLEDTSCDFKMCGTNKPTPLIKLLLPEQVVRCMEPWKCLTVVVKTARRPRLVLRLAQSIRDSFHYDLPIVCFDDGPSQHPREVQQEIAKFPLMKYVVGEKEDYGIAEGRNMALSFVKTKYFLLLDDDMLLLNTTQLELMIDILDTTDATVVGGQMVDRNNFASLMKFGYFGGTTRKLGLFPMTCDKANRTVPNHPTCVQCDLNTNVFMARTSSILQIGGWDPELKVLEHKDIFLRLKAAGYKVAVCRQVKVKHDPPAKGSDEMSKEYQAKRTSNYFRYSNLLLNRYNIETIFFKYGQDVNDKGEILFFEFEEEVNRC